MDTINIDKVKPSVEVIDPLSDIPEGLFEGVSDEAFDYLVKLRERAIIPANPIAATDNSSDTLGNVRDVLTTLEFLIADRGGTGGFDQDAWNGLCLTLQCVRSSVEHAKQQIESERREASNGEK